MPSIRSLAPRSLRVLFCMNCLELPAVPTFAAPDGPLSTVTSYDESATQVRQVSMTYGAEGELLGKSGSTEPFTRVYDAAYRLKTLKDGLLNSTGYSYNSAGYLDTVTYPGSQTVQYPIYNLSGQPLKRIDGNSVETDSFYFNGRGQLTDVMYPASSSLNLHEDFDGYDRRTNRNDAVGAASFTYDDLDAELSAQTTYTGLTAQTVSYTFNPDSSRDTMVTPAGTFSYGYDGAGRPNSLSNPSSESFSWSYQDNNDLLTQSLPGSVTTTYTQNARGFLTRLQTSNGLGVLSDFGGAGGMVYDSVANRTSMPATVTGVTSATGTTSYTYDTKDELTQESSARNGSYTNNWAFDAAFNPTTIRGTTHTFNSNNQDSSWTFDSNGNPTTYRGSTITYDPENRATAIGSLLTAGYDGDNLRAWKQNSGGTRTYFIYDGADPVCELNSSGTVVATNTFGAHGLLSRHTTSSVFYTFDPREASASGPTPVAASLPQACSMALEHCSAPAPASRGDTWPRKGYFTDSETGLILCTHRYYDPTEGRWLTRDPIGYEGGINVYGYAGNSPITRIDPDGLLHIIFSPSGGKGRIKVYADPGDTIPRPRPMNGESWMGPAEGGELVVNAPATNETTNPNGNPKRNGSDGPAPPGTYDPGPTKNNGKKGPRADYIPSEGPYFIPVGIPNRPAIGIHAGGKHGLKSPTQGCIRTTTSACDDIAILLNMNWGRDNRITILK